jgi:hypothetical protein
MMSKETAELGHGNVDVLFLKPSQPTTKMSRFPRTAFCLKWLFRKQKIKADLSADPCRTSKCGGVADDRSLLAMVLGSRPIRPSLRMRVGTLLLLCAPLGMAASEAVTVMEPFIVLASKGPPWRYFTVPGFEVLSRCPDRFNEAYARALQRSVAARAAVLPPDFFADLATPVKILLYNKPPESGFTFSRSKPIDLQMSPLGDALEGAGVIEETSPVVAGDGDTFIICGNYWNLISSMTDLSIDPDTDLRLQLRTPAFPAWFKAGATGRYGVFAHRILQPAASGRSIAAWPNAFWISRDETVAIRKNPKHPRESLSLAELFGGSGRGRRQDLWNSEAALFVRWGLFGRDAGGNGYRNIFLRFVERATRDPVTEQLFRECFGLGFAEAQQKLDDYLPRAVTESVTAPVAAATDEEPDIRDAAPDEVARIIGDWGRFAGKAPRFGFVEAADRDDSGEGLDRAAKLFERTYANGNREPLFLAAYGLYKAQIGDAVAAREVLGAATTAGVVRPKAYLELARLRLIETLLHGTQGSGDSSEANYEEIWRLVATARRQMPSLLGCYQLMTRLWERAPRTPTHEELAVLGEGVRLFPRNAAFICRVATLYQHLGYPDDARAIIERAKGLAESPDAQALLSGFNTSNHPREERSRLEEVGSGSQRANQ